MKKWFLLALLLFIAPAAFAQNTTVSASFSDSASQALAYGTWTLKFSPSPNSPSGPYSWNGSAFNIQTSYTGTLNSSGALTSFSIQSTNFITPSGNSWTLTVCPAATTNCSSGNVIITGSTQDLSTAITIPAIQVQANTSNQSAAYSDAEIQGAVPGYVYWNITSSTLRVCAGPLPCTWTAVGGGGGGSVTAVTGTSPIVSSGGTTPAISCPTCNTSSATIGGTTTASHLPYSTGANTLADIAGSSANAAGDVTLAPTTGTILMGTGASGGDGIDLTFAAAPAGPFTSAFGALLNAGGTGFDTQVSDTNGAAATVSAATLKIFETDSTASGKGPDAVGIQGNISGSNVSTDTITGLEAEALDMSTGGAALDVAAIVARVTCTSRTLQCNGVEIGPLNGSPGASYAGLRVDSQSGNSAIVTEVGDPSTLGLLTAATVTAATVTASNLTSGDIPQATTAGKLINSSPLLDNGVTTANTLTYAGSGGIVASALTDSALTSGRCVQAGTAGLLGNATAACNTPAFSAITPGTNTTAAMVLGSGSSLTVSGTGTNNATAIDGVTVTGTPTSGQVPTATSGTAATWQTPGGGSGTVTSVTCGTGLTGGTFTTSGTCAVGGAAGEILAGATPALTFTPTLGVSGTAGTLALFPASGNFTTTLGSAATASNTVNFFATAPTTGDLVDCVTSSTTCTMTDSGVLAANVTTNSVNYPSNSVTYATGNHTQAGSANLTWVSPTLTIGVSGTAGSLTEFNNTASTTWSSGATTSNTIAGFTAVPATGDIVTCTTVSTTCTLTDSGQAPFNPAVPGAIGGTTPAAGTFTTLIGNTSVTAGVAGTTSGLINLKGSTSGTATITGPATAGTSTNPIVFSNVLQAPNGAVLTPGYGFSTSCSPGGSGMTGGGSTTIAACTGQTVNFNVNGSNVVAVTASELQPIGGSNIITLGDSTHVFKNVQADAVFIEGTTFTVSGCTTSSLVGGATAGKFASGTTGTCAVTITMGNTATAPNGWTCWGNDLTTPALFTQTGGSTTTAILSGTTASGDTVNFGCLAY